MTSSGEASLTIEYLRWKLWEVFHENVDGFRDELGSLHLINHQEYIDLYLTEGSAAQTDRLLDLILQKGEAACEKFLDHLENMVLRFPGLLDVSQYLEGGEKPFNQLVETMKMKHYLTSKLTMRDILSIGAENLLDKHPETVEDLPWYYLRKLMALNMSARDVLLKKNQDNDNDDNDDDNDNDDDDDDHSGVSTSKGGTMAPSSINPLDVLCVLLHCSDSFLQQEIVTKMVMCQFAVPLLLPASDESPCTLMLWAMRDIVKSWRPQSLADGNGFREGNVVNVPMSIFSFVRLGKTKLSKSATLNQVLNAAQQHHNFFIHHDMEGGNIERKIADGLVEMSWYFPRDNSDVFPEPITVTNLRGDLEANWNRFTFLTQVSSAVFIFIENISERLFRLLSSCFTTDTQYYLIVTPGPGKNISPTTKACLKNLKEKLNISSKQIIEKSNTLNNAEFVQKIQRTLQSLLRKNPRQLALESMKKQARGLQIIVDENSTECRKARKCTVNITSVIENVEEYKKETLNLQGDLWKQLSKVEKELCRMTNQGEKDVQQYQDELNQQRISLHRQQSQHNLPNGIMLFTNALTDLSQAEKRYFLKWMKSELDSIARNNISALQAEYKEKYTNKLSNREELKQIDQNISDSSLGVEHFLRELGQFYEAECSIMNSIYMENKLTESQKQFARIPEIAVDLLLDGFPLELIDGDASNIPLQWVTDVLSELDNKTGGQCRIRVITVLGVQSTGKSTLLNTMFGLQFPVASGRCTRGAFMTLLNVKENLQEELGCQFILVIDTEGLKALELASLEGSYEHDNELATLVIGLSDITIINMSMENNTEMKDILQIVVHAFLRMKEVGKKPNCQFVHQNVSDVSAYEKNMRDRKKLLEQLNEMTKVAAEMEKKSEIKTFSDVMDYNLEKDNWYIPGLWLGVPPMAPVNSGYSEYVYRLKKYLIELMKSKKTLHKPLTISEFITWIKSLWKAVKHEKFIFSFRNSLVAEAYNKLSIQFSQWEWEFRKAVHGWQIRTETNIKNQSAMNLNEELCSGYKDGLQMLLFREKDKMLGLLKKYFDNKSENVHLIERYKEDFVLSIESLKKELERNTLGKCEEAVSIQKGKFKIQNIQNTSQGVIEEKITDLLRRCRERNEKLSDAELEREFEEVWEKTLAGLETDELRRNNVGRSMLQKLRNDMNTKGSSIHQVLVRVKNLELSEQSDFKMTKKYIECTWYTNFISTFGYSNEPSDKIRDLATFLIKMNDDFIRKKMKTAADYDDTYGQELLCMINRELSKQAKSLHYSSLFELDIKLHILRRAAAAFQKMHDTFIKENDPKICLENLKPQYLSTFLNIFQEKDVCQNKAKEFCQRCLQPAVMDFVFKQLGKEIVDDIVNGSDNKTFSSRSFFQSFLLKELLEEMSFDKYIEYIISYGTFTKAWMLNYITKKYTHSQALKSLQERILSSVNKRVRSVLAEEKSLKSASISDFLETICKLLKDELVIPQNEMKVVTFHNMATVDQFSLDIQHFLRDTETEILSQLESMDFESVLSRVTLKPQDELFRKVVGCGKQCPFCKVPCEAGGDEHKEHFSSIHRSVGLGGYRKIFFKNLVTDICSTSVVSDVTFRNCDTEMKSHPYKEYRTYYPDWAIQPDTSIETSDYWKYVFVQFNKQFAQKYEAKPADIPETWKDITKEKALWSLMKVFNTAY